MCSVNDIKKARYTVQVMTPVLYMLYSKMLIKKTIIILVVLILITG